MPDAGLSYYEIQTVQRLVILFLYFHGFLALAKSQSKPVRLKAESQACFKTECITFISKCTCDSAALVRAQPRQDLVDCLNFGSGINFMGYALYLFVLVEKTHFANIRETRDKLN